MWNKSVLLFRDEKKFIGERSEKSTIIIIPGYGATRKLVFQLKNKNETLLRRGGSE